MGKSTSLKHATMTLREVRLTGHLVVREKQNIEERLCLFLFLAEKQTHDQIINILIAKLSKHLLTPCYDSALLFPLPAYDPKRFTAVLVKLYYRPVYTCSRAFKSLDRSRVRTALELLFNDFWDILTAVKKFWIASRKREQSSLNAYTLFYRQTISFQHIGKHVRAKINDFRISLKHL